MPNILQEICDHKRTKIDQDKEKIPLKDLQEKCQNLPETKGFIKNIKNKISQGKFALIAEIKKASPSKGLICENFRPKEFARSYEKGGATCLSVLTETQYFQGSMDYLKQVRKTVSLPILQKDFILDPYQVFQARKMGADCILLIMAALDDHQAKEIENTAHELNMDVLIEIHNLNELQRSFYLNSQLIGINNRNLKTLKVNLDTTVELSAHIPSDKIIVSESGLSCHDDLLRMSDHRVDTFLIGDYLMRQKDLTQATQTILNGQK